MEKMEVNTAEDMILFTGATAEILANPNEISPSTQAKVLEKVEHLLETVDKSIESKELIESLSGVITLSNKAILASANIVDEIEPNKAETSALKSLAGNSNEAKNKVGFILF